MPIDEKDNQPKNEETAPEQEVNATEAETEEAESETAENAGAAELAEMKDKYLRLAAEFENFRRRTAKERIDTLKTANQEMMLALLPVLDDLERAQKAMDEASDVKAVKEGVQLVFNKLQHTLQHKGLKAIDAKGEAFDTEKHEAITQIPAPSEDLKGKVVDEVERGYSLNDKVIRFAKVVIGA